jgi:hypothetical protein
MGSTHLAAEAFDCRIAGRGHRPHRHLGPKATREDGRHLSLRSRVEHGIDRLSHGRRCVLQFQRYPHGPGTYFRHVAVHHSVSSLTPGTNWQSGSTQRRLYHARISRFAKSSHRGHYLGRFGSVPALGCIRITDPIFLSISQSRPRTSAALSMKSPSRSWPGLSCCERSPQASSLA